MPWNETEAMTEKIKFISAYMNNTGDTFKELCERFNISCKTGYKYVNRYKVNGIDGLKELSTAPHNHPNKVPADIENSILEVKYKCPTWGAKKIRNWLLQEQSGILLPATSTIDQILKRNDLVIPAKRKKRVMSYNQPLHLCTNVNDSWSIDYKGQFLLGNKQYCYPFTVTDNFSRYILAIEGSTRISGAEVKKILKKLFKKHGLPVSIRSDNGQPFASIGLAGLSEVAVWLIKLDIIPERIRAGHPQENGRHERMHLTLKQDTYPPKADLPNQQRAFNNFVKNYNENRPHEGINHNRPAWLYSKSTREFPAKLGPVEYDNSFLKTQKINSHGKMKWCGKDVFISEALKGEVIGMKPYSEDEWLMYFSFMPLGIISEKTCKVTKIC